MTTAREKYQIYIRRTADSYITPSPLGSQEPLGMRVWCWSPYRKRGKSGALSSKWSGPWRIVEFKPPALTLLQSEWLHLKGKPEVQREAVIDKIRPYLETGDVQEDLEDDELAMMDGDKEATDPQVEAAEILERIPLITCCAPKRRRKPKKSDLIKDEGEGDWGTGEAVTDDQPVQEGSTRQLPTDWPKDFHPWEPSIRPGETDQDEIALPEGDEVTLPLPTGDQPTPGPSTGPTPAKDVSCSAHQKQGQPGHTRREGDKSANKKQSAVVFTEGERDRLTPLISTNTQKHTTPALTRGYKTGEKRQQKSVVRQEPEGQHSRQGKTTDPKPVRERASRSGGHSTPTTPTSTRQTQTRVTSPSEGTRV